MSAEDEKEGPENAKKQNKLCNNPLHTNINWLLQVKELTL